MRKEQSNKCRKHFERLLENLKKEKKKEKEIALLADMLLICEETSEFKAHGLVTLCETSQHCDKHLLREILVEADAIAKQSTDLSWYSDYSVRSGNLWLHLIEDRDVALEKFADSCIAYERLKRYKEADAAYGVVEALTRECPLRRANIVLERMKALGIALMLNEQPEGEKRLISLYYLLEGTIGSYKNTDSVAKSIIFEAQGVLCGTSSKLGKIGEELLELAFSGKQGDAYMMMCLGCKDKYIRGLTRKAIIRMLGEKELRNEIVKRIIGVCKLSVLLRDDCFFPLIQQRAGREISQMLRTMNKNRSLKQTFWAIKKRLLNNQDWKDYEMKALLTLYGNALEHFKESETESESIRVSEKTAQRV